MQKGNQFPYFIKCFWTSAARHKNLLSLSLPQPPTHLFESSFPNSLITHLKTTLKTQCPTPRPPLSLKTSISRTSSPSFLLSVSPVSVPLPPLPQKLQSLKNHLHYLNWYKKPITNQDWRQVADPCDSSSLKWVSSLSLSPHHHRAATPSDLVLVVYVVLLAQLGRGFRANLDVSTWIALRDFAALFVPIWCQWSSHTGFLNLYEAKDKIIYFFVLICIASQCFNFLLQPLNFFQ